MEEDQQERDGIGIWRIQLLRRQNVPSVSDIGAVKVPEQFPNKVKLFYQTSMSLFDYERMTADLV